MQFILQTSQTCWTLPPPWLDEKDHITTEQNPAEEITHPVITTTTTTDQVNRRRAFILRSKSDVGPSRFAPDLLPAVPPEFTGDVPRDLDLFFDTVGHLQQDPTFEGRSCSPVTYFSSVSSVDSACRRVTTRHVDNQGESSDSEDMAATLQRRLLGTKKFIKLLERVIINYDDVFRESTRNGGAVDNRAERPHHKMAHQMP